MRSGSSVDARCNARPRHMTASITSRPYCAEAMDQSQSVGFKNQLPNELLEFCVRSATKPRECNSAAGPSPTPQLHRPGGASHSTLQTDCCPERCRDVGVCRCHAALTGIHDQACRAGSRRARGRPLAAARSQADVHAVIIGQVAEQPVRRPAATATANSNWQ
jgi:hypothetical protein